MSKAYKVRVVVTKTMWVTQDDIDADCKDGLFEADPPQIDEFAAISYCKGVLMEELRNNPNRGSADIISIYDPDTKTIMTKRKYLKWT